MKYAMRWLKRLGSFIHYFKTACFIYIIDASSRKIIYLDCRERYQDTIDYCSYAHNLSSCEIVAFCIQYLTIRLQARVFYEQIVNEAQPSWLSLVENEGE